ncbi:NUDIX hydrolase [Streptomyces sp. ITFR-16]|uniref:NUDIX hydrolase n=1 Tax=Streptomyces sp. ITFR-16 TaxID=3075198 RepID=UPI00288AD565|nr:NUDIX hydrolase [Streptomyces sp. ITFR-16]WNI23487.1 NUDIX hydrolase [Streptomyces sp. ITFR-16]
MALGGGTLVTSKAEVAVAAAIVARDARVLLVQRRVTEGDLSWQFPAGKIEPGERDCCRRRCQRGYAARAAGGVMVASCSTGVNRARRFWRRRWW